MRTVPPKAMTLAAAELEFKLPLVVRPVDESTFYLVLDLWTQPNRVVLNLNTYRMENLRLDRLVMAHPDSELVIK